MAPSRQGLSSHPAPRRVDEQNKPHPNHPDLERFSQYSHFPRDSECLPQTFMVSSSSTDPMYQHMNQPDTRVQFHGQPVSQNSSNRPMASDATQCNAPMTQEARYTYNHHNSPATLQTPFQAQNLQKHQYDQEKQIQQLDHVRGSSQPQNLHWNQENWHHQYFMHMNQQNHQSSFISFHNQRNMALDLNYMNPQMSQQLALNSLKDQPGPSSLQITQDNYISHQALHQPLPIAQGTPGSFRFLNDEFDKMNMAQVANHQTLHPARDCSLRGIPKNAELKLDFMNLRGPTIAFETPKDQPGPSSFQQIPDNYMNHQIHHQPVTNAGKNQDLMHCNNQFMYPPMSQQHSHGTPGPSYLQGTTNNFQFGSLDQKNTAPNQFLNQMPPHLAFGTNGTPNYVALPQQNNGFPPPGQNAIAFILLNAATWKFLSTFPNEMMVTNDGRSIFPRFEIGIMNLIPKANYNVGIKLQLVNPKKHTYNVNEKKWREVDRPMSKKLPEQETNEVHSEVQSGQDIMTNGLKMKLVNIYTIGHEKKKASATSGPMTEERIRMMEHKNKIREQKMIRVFSQQKYVPIFTLYQQMDFGTPQPIATTQFPDTEFITTTSYRNETLKKWKRNNNEFVRGDLRDLDI